MLYTLNVYHFPRFGFSTFWDDIYMDGYRSGHNGAVLKTVRVQAHGGSNPSPSVQKPANKPFAGFFSFQKSEVSGPLFYSYWTMFAIFN